MALKDLFKEVISPSVSSNKSLDTIAEEVESADYLKRFVEERETFIPHVDLSDPRNFARFGLAEKYYEDSIKRIYQQYPYDGSRKEKIEWHLSSSFLDKYLFDNEYPRTNGYALMSATGWGTKVDNSGYYGATATASYEYIQVKGGPNKHSGSAKLAKIYPSAGGKANIHDTSNDRESNLKFDLENKGVTIEFWLQKDGFTPLNAFGGGNTTKEVIFDLWNGEASSSADYGRLTLELSGTTVSESPFYITAQSGSSGFFNQQIGSSIAGTGSLTSWKHYAISLIANTAASTIDVKFYVNGELNQSTALGSAGIGNVTGPLIANIGALRNSPSGTAFNGVAMEGWGKLSGSLDEFRYWKTKRTSEQIGRQWFTQVGAGTNTDTANTKLGVYYKFNEGITEHPATDAVVLDYSGRVSNGAWTGRSSASRATGSAMVLSNAAKSEFKDPIIHTNHPQVIKLMSEKRLEGKEHDHRNNSSIFNSYPGWITEEDGEDGDLRKLSQVISSYFDKLYLQIEAVSDLKDVEYVTGSMSSSYKPLPFANKLLISNGLITPDIFVNAEIIEEFLDRDEVREFEFKLADVKNTIYQNIYNNLTYIYKSKGAEKSFRNLIRCFGVDDELIKLNLYADNIDYTLEDTYREASYRNTYADFNDPSRFQATVHQYTNANNSNTVSYLSASTTQGLETGSTLTVEAEILFPNKLLKSDVVFFDTPFSKSCLFGMHTADTSLSDSNFAFSASMDVSNFQVFAVRNDILSSHAKFMLTGSSGGHVPNLTSSIFLDTYNNERWILAFRMKPSKYPLVGQIAGTDQDTYEINFYGANATFGEVQNEFELTGTLTHAQGMSILSNPKRIFGGAHRQNFTGSVLNKTDVKLGSLRVWYDYLSNESLKAHAIDPANAGVLNPSRRAYLFDDNLVKKSISEIETLALNWNFETLTASNASGQFTVPDLSSGSNSTRHGWISNIINRQHSGRGYGFMASTTASLDKEYNFAYRQQLPEMLYSADTVNILSDDDQTFTREKRPIKHYFALEKSMYQEMSLDMLRMFATIKDFNNLLGEPVNRYRQEYKDLSKLRQLFFERVRNTPDFEKFVTFYKWFDSSLNELIFQLLPASANISEKIGTLVESHILERNKYWTKFPTLEPKSSDPEGEARGINELMFNWRFGHAPISNNENENCFWWDEKAERDGVTITSGDANVDSDRNQILTASLQTLNRRFGTPHRLSVGEVLTLRGGVDLPTNKRPDAFLVNLKPSTSETIDITLRSVPDCLDGQDSPTRFGKKIRIPLDAVGGLSADVRSGDTIAPFSVFSSSAGNTSLAIAPGKELTNFHHDGYGDFKEKPLQGPFTEKYVGGQRYRHHALAKATVLATAAVAAKTAGENAANADYTSTWSTGDRSGNSYAHASKAEIYVQPNALDSSNPHQILVDSLTNTGQSFLTIANVSGKYISFNFNTAGGSTVDRATVITEAKWTYYQTSPRSDQGVWKYQGSNNSTDGDDGDWTDIGSSFTLADYDAATSVGIFRYELHTELSSNTTAYSFYRVVGVSGDCGSGLDIREVDFKVAFAADAIPATYRLKNETERAEGFRLKIDASSEAISLMQPEKDSAGNINLNLPTARYFRDETAKRPLNIRNILQTTGSTIIGNYDKLYQVVQTSNRRTNNQWWVENQGGDGVSPWVPPRFRSLGEAVNLLPDDSFAVSGAALPVGAHFWHNNYFIISASVYTRPQRGRTPNVIVERFSAPGGPEVAGTSDGGWGLDTLSAEYSLYNTMNYRNSIVRQFFNIQATNHGGQFGFHKDYVLGGTAADTASFHKVNRNTLRRVEYSGPGLTITTASVRDNLFVQHPLPRGDAGYAWISASATSAPLGFAIDSRKFPNDNETIAFLSASEHNLNAINVSFVGMNVYINDPISSSSNTLSASNGEYRNTILTAISASEVLNALNLHRNGPYQYPMWKQMRTGEHPIARYQRNNNKVDYIKPVETYTEVVQLGLNEQIVVPVLKNFTRKTVIEPIASSRFKPLRHALNMDTDDGPKTFTLKHSYGNNVSYFSNESLNNNLFWPRLDSRQLSAPYWSEGRALPELERPQQVYDDITDLYINSTDPGPSNPINNFVSLRYSETIYPRAVNAFLDRTRSRTNYDVGSILKWRTGRTDRAQEGAAGSQGKTAEQNSLPPYTSSMWPLDGRFFAGSSGGGITIPAGFLSASILEVSSSTLLYGAGYDSQLTGGLDGCGELLSDYSQFHNGNIANVTASAMYARRQLGFTLTRENELRTVAAGDALWEAPAQAGKGPFDDTYDDFSERIKRIGKDFTIVPEFTISDHIDYYVDQNAGNFFVDIPDNIFSLDGAPVSSSADPATVNDKKFYSLYNSTEFLKHFAAINRDHAEMFDTGLTLSCEALMKFRPREGFYPAQRTLQLATLFSQSYGDIVDLTGENANFRTLLTPFFAPGIMFNTIKSGIAVDYPIMTEAYAVGHKAVIKAGQTDGNIVWQFPADANMLVGGYNSYDAAYSAGKVSPGSNLKATASFYYISGTFDDRIPFESILDPQRFFVGGRAIVDNEPHPSASLNSTASVFGTGKALYTLAAHNFFAETADFYLKKRDGEVGTFTSFISKESKDINPEKTKTYKMDVILTNQVGVTNTDATALTAIEQTAYPTSICMYCRAHLKHYENTLTPGVLAARNIRPGTTAENIDFAFGPPVHEHHHTEFNAVVGNLYYLGAAPFTPPYYDGPAKVTLEFTPRLHDATPYSIQKIVNELTATYSREGVLNQANSGNFAYTSAMQLSSSITLDGILETKKITRDPIGNILTIEDAEPAQNAQNFVWVIESKFETPILDFNDADVTFPFSGTVGYDGTPGRHVVAGQTPRGMWHQYGTVPKGSEEGIFLQLSDTDEAGIDSLADLVGFGQKRTKKLGVPATKKIVSEAVVAIPFIRGTGTNIGEMAYIPLDSDPEIARSRIGLAKRIIATRPRQTDITPEDFAVLPSDSTIDMVERMQKYVLPPKLDFVRNPANVRTPILIYIFEFEHQFGEQDLVDMWQNLLPDQGSIEKRNVAKATATHSELFARLNELDKTLDDVQWIVFKAKQRASVDYYEKTLTSKDDNDLILSDTIRRNAALLLPESIEDKIKYSYNWPYDYFSLVELIKVNADIEFTPVEEEESE